MQVKIIKCSNTKYWYCPFIGRIYRVNRIIGNDAEIKINKNIKYIDLKDCEIIDDNNILI
jgi:hypothetical protein